MMSIVECKAELPRMLAQEASEKIEPHDWSELPSLPIAVSGAYAGVVNNSLVIAGGTNFKDDVRPWNGGVKQWHDTIYILSAPDSKWEQSPVTLPRPLGYGVAISTPEGLWCIGGSDHNQHFAETFLIAIENDQIVIKPGPNLPQPLSYACGSLVGNAILIAGGTTSPQSLQAERCFYRLDLSVNDEKRHWESLKPWDGPARMLGTAATIGDSFYLFGGIDLKADADGNPVRVKPYLSDAYCYKQSGRDNRQWSRVSDLPVPCAAAPTPSPAFDADSIIILGGDDGAQNAALRDSHQGFSPTIWRYSVSKDSWNDFGMLPKKNSSAPDSNPHGCIWPPVTTGAITWQNKLLLPTGEIRPGVRTDRILVLDMPENNHCSSR